MGHVSVLQSGRGFLIQVGRVGTQDQKSNREMIQLHAHVCLSV